MAKTSICKTSVEGDVITFTFSNGTTRQVSMDLVSTANKPRLVLFGLEENMRNSYAGCGGEVETAIGLFDKRLDTLASENWTSREPGEPKESSLELLAGDIASAYDKPLIGVLAKLTELSANNEGKEKIKAYRKNAQVMVAAAIRKGNKLGTINVDF